MPYSILIFLSLSAIGLSSQASASFELLCRNQAKEIAAETYKNCVTEHRQGQVEQIRKEYQEKLAELKSHYDGELKKVSTGSSKTKGTPSKSSPLITKPEAKSVLKRVSGARELPEKKVSSSMVKSEVIDFSNTTSKDDASPSEEMTEIVEIPIE